MGEKNECEDWEGDSEMERWGFNIRIEGIGRERVKWRNRKRKSGKSGGKKRGMKVK